MLKQIVFPFLVTICMSSTAYGQFVSAIINDPDGFTNVRKSNSIDSKISGKIYDGEVFEFNGDDLFEKKDWINVYMIKGSNNHKCKEDTVVTKYLYGYIHKSRMLPINQIEQKISRNKLTETEVLFSNDSLSVKIGIRKLTEQENKDLYYSCIWGTDTGNPINVINTLEVRSNSKTIEIPITEFNDLYRANLDMSTVTLFIDHLFITMSNSDAAGFYEVTWVIEKGKYKKRYINIGP